MTVEDQKLLLDALELEKLDPSTRSAFEKMLEDLESGERNMLSAKQRSWVRGVLDIPEYENLASKGKLARGREVPTPEVLKRENLPMKPPGRQ